MAGDEVVLRVVGDAGSAERAFKSVAKQAGESMAKAQASVDKANAGIGASSQKIAAAIGGASGKIGRLQGSLAENASALGIAQREQLRLTARYGEGSIQADRANLAVQRLTNAHAISTAELNAAQSALTKNATGWQKATSRVGAMSATMVAAGSTMRRTGSRLARNVSLPLLAIGGLGIKTAIDYERNMNVLQAVSGATGEQMAGFGSLAQTLGADLTLPGTSAADAAAAMVELAKAGLSVNDVMGAVKGVLQLSAAGAMDNATSAAVAANAVNAFHLKGTDAVRVADLLAAAANASSAEVSDLADSLTQGGSVFAQAGIPLEDFVSSAALLANVGITGSDAGTSLKSMLLKLQNPSKEAAGIMRDLGLSVYDAQGRMKPLRSLIADFTSKTKGLSQEQRDAAMATIFGSDAVRAANAVLLDGAPAFDKMKAATTEQGAAAKLAGARNKGLGGALDALKSSLETFALKVLVPALPVLSQFALALANFLPKITNLPKPVLIVGAALAGLLVVVGPLAWLFGAITTVVAGLAVVFGILTAPVSLVIITLAGLAALLMFAWQRFEIFRTVVETTFNVVKTVITTIITGIVLEFTDFVTIVKTIWDTLWNGLGGVVSSVFGGIVSGIKGALDTVIATINTAIALYNKLPTPDLGMLGGGGGGGGGKGGGSTAGKVVGGVVKTALSATPLGGIAGMLGLAHGGMLLGVNRPTPLLVGEGRGKEDVLAVPHSKGGLAGMGVTQHVTINGSDMPTAAALDYAARALGWRMAVAGRR